MYFRNLENVKNSKNVFVCLIRDINYLIYNYKEIEHKVTIELML